MKLTTRDTLTEKGGKSPLLKRAMMMNPNHRLLNDTQLPPSLADTHVALVTNFDRNHESVRFSINSNDQEQRIDNEFLVHDYREAFPPGEQQ
jgi:hypothetical protein